MSSDRSGGATAAGSGAGEPKQGFSDSDTTGYTSERSIPVRDDDYAEPRHTSVREDTVVQRQVRPVDTDNDDRGPVNVAVGAERQDGVRWGPIWAGLLTALTTFLLLELLFFWLGWLTLDPGEADQQDSRGLVTGILALVAFFLGGVIAGATAIWKGLFSGLLHGFMVWALGVVAFIALTFFGGSALLGSFGDLTNQLGVGPQQVQSATNVSEAEEDKVVGAARDVAAPAFWGLFLPLSAAMLGGLIGSKMWPRRDETDPDTVTLRA